MQNRTRWNSKWNSHEKEPGWFVRIPVPRWMTYLTLPGTLQDNQIRQVTSFLENGLLDLRLVAIDLQDDNIPGQLRLRVPPT
jgi:hypothetical protein